MRHFSTCVVQFVTSSYFFLVQEVSQETLQTLQTMWVNGRTLEYVGTRIVILRLPLHKLTVKTLGEEIDDFQKLGFVETPDVLSKRSNNPFFSRHLVSHETLY